MISPHVPSTPPAAERVWTPTEVEALGRDLVNAVEGEVRLGFHDRMLYATDASLYQVEPLGVVIPASIEDAMAAVEFCSRHGLPILPRGGGTSLAGQCTNRAVVIDFSAHCRSIVELDVAGRRVRVEPGITIDDLNEAIASSGLFFAPDPATTRQCNIGGCIGNNAAGARSILYGRTSESVIAVDAMLLRERGVMRARLEAGASERDASLKALTLGVAQVVHDHADLIRAKFPKTIRRNAGYQLDMILAQMDAAGPRADADEIARSINLAKLLCGSEGTLGVTLGAELALHPVPRAKGLAVIGFNSIEAAIDAVMPILASKPSAVEMLDDTIIDLARANAEYRAYVEMMPAPRSGPLKAILYVEYFGFSGAEEVRGKLEELKAIVRRVDGASEVSTFTDGPSMLRAWKLRKAGEPLLHGMPGERKPLTFVEDNAVPVERLSEFVRQFRRIVESRGTNAAFWAHASVGVLHVRPFLSIRDEQDRQLMREIAVEVADLAASLGGVMSGEHGDGRVRGPLLERFYGPELMGAFRQVKRLFDPRGLLNPGNIVRPGPIESIGERVRVKPGERFIDVPAVETYFDYEDQHGFGGAVEMCNGAGVCRKKSGGTMCPSYMATLDERHSTRGRGNALRLAITGQARGEGETGAPAGPAWDDPGTMATLDLCLSCKACKTECPSNVDISRLKAEYTAQRYKAGTRVPLQARVFASIRSLNRLGSLTPGLANWMNRTALARLVLDRVLGLSPKRSLPEFARGLDRQWGLDASRSLPADAPEVALFMDCFTGYNEPRIGLAAKRVLRGFGYRVRLIDAGCCGRAAISMGQLAEASSSIDATLARLNQSALDPRVRAVLVCEPSCLSAIKDDWLQLKLRTPMATRRALAAKSFLVEEFLDRGWNDHPRRPLLRQASGGVDRFGDPSAPVVLHAHCHQKALWGAASSAGILKRLAGDNLRVLDSGCCGMAGSFGFTKDRFDLSMKIGELSVLPAVRRAVENSPCSIVAPGTSCRHQILDGTGVHAMHPIEHLAHILELEILDNDR